MIDSIGGSGNTLARLYQERLAATGQTTNPANLGPGVGAVQPTDAAVQTLTESAKTELSSFILQGFLKEAMPKDLVGSEGAGTAGAMWRSLFAQELSKVLAQSGQIDLLPETPHVGLSSADANQWKTVIK